MTTLTVFIDHANNEARLCSTNKYGYKKMSATLEKGLEFEGPYSAHMWLKNNGYSLIGTYLINLAEKVERWGKR